MPAHHSAIDVLMPTYNRHSSFSMALAGVAAQSYRDLRVIVADQSDMPVHEVVAVKALARVIQARGGTVEWHHRGQVHGIAEQRDFLLRQACADFVLFLDDDVYMESWLVQKLMDVIWEQGCGFVGAFPVGLSFSEDIRPEQQAIEYWASRVRPEALYPGTPDWERWQLHRAANLHHVSLRLPPGVFRLYKVAWVAACILYDRHKLEAVGGFSFWNRLPRYHTGEEVLVQNLLMRRWGGCGLAPSGAYFSQAPSTVLNDAGSVDGHALDLLSEMIERYAPEARSSTAMKARDDEAGHGA